MNAKTVDKDKVTTMMIKKGRVELVIRLGLKIVQYDLRVR